MHPTTFEYLKPTEKQIEDMAQVRAATAVLSGVLHKNVPEGPDKTYLMRKLREVAMWANIAITRYPEGGPRA